MTPEQKLAARKFNEQTRLTANAVNALAIAIIGAAAIVPGVTNPVALLTWQTLILIVIALAVHLLARASLNLIRSEE